jgi:hypothetical protein
MHAQQMQKKGLWRHRRCSKHKAIFLTGTELSGLIASLRSNLIVKTIIPVIRRADCFIALNTAINNSQLQLAMTFTSRALNVFPPAITFLCAFFQPVSSR